MAAAGTTGEAEKREDQNDWPAREFCGLSGERQTDAEDGDFECDVDHGFDVHMVRLPQRLGKWHSKHRDFLRPTSAKIGRCVGKNLLGWSQNFAGVFGRDGPGGQTGRIGQPGSVVRRDGSAG